MDATGTRVQPSSRLVIREEHDGKVARLVLTNPPDNAIDLPMAAELVRALDALAAWPNLAAVVLEGDGLTFSTGLLPSHRRPPYGDELVRSFLAAMRKLVGLEALVVAAVRGRCFGAAFELTLGAHLFFCEPSAKFALDDAQLGGFPLVAPLLLRERISHARAEEWIVSGRVVEAEEAHAAGLVTAFPGGWENLASMVDRHLAQAVLARPVASVRALARSLSLARSERLERDLPELERLFAERVASGADFAEGLSAVLRRRPPRWGREPA